MRWSKGKIIFLASTIGLAIFYVILYVYASGSYTLSYYQ